MRSRKSSSRPLRRSRSHPESTEAVWIIEALCLAGCKVARPITDPEEYKFPIQLSVPIPPEHSRVYSAGITLPDPVHALGEKGMRRFEEFFSKRIRNKNTRRAYARAIGDFISFCECGSLASVTPDNIIKYVHYLLKKGTLSTARQRLSAIRHLYSWLSNGRILPNPASLIAIHSLVDTLDNVPDIIDEAGLQDRRT